jgi:hypothetical protein
MACKDKEIGLLRALIEKGGGDVNVPQGKDKVNDILFLSYVISGRNSLGPFGDCSTSG